MFIPLTCLYFPSGADDYILSPCRVNTDHILYAYQGVWEEKGEKRKVTIIQTIKDEITVIETLNEVSNLLSCADGIKSNNTPKTRVSKRPPKRPSQLTYHGI